MFCTPATEGTSILTITDKAKEELKRILDRTSRDPGKVLRLAIPPVWVGEGDFGIVIDGEALGDHVVSFQGAKVLLIDEFLTERLSSSTLDFKDSPQGSRFTLDVF